jgi:DNA-directed RNA polymerase specialized sigma24 family protein
MSRWTASATCRGETRAGRPPSPSTSGALRPGIDEVLASQELVRRVLVHTDRRTQEVVVLVIFDEMPQEQAAEMLGISRKTVNERLKRFRAQAEKQVRRWST